MTRAYEVSGFCMRQVEPSFVGTKLTHDDIDAIMVYVNANPDKSRPGYMDGVLVWSIPMDLIPGVMSPVAEITDANRHQLVSEYRARRDGEIPILVRYLKGAVKVQPSTVDAVIYTRKQLESESEGEACVGIEGDLIVVLANRYEGESLMDPNTMIRNHMGPDFGGSGKPLDKEVYAKSVAFWNGHALVE